ncbi:hypothetical protein BDB01DRAFT_853405 [Pilobolus umbonatus]|nr:hypothetical protein BDB01DRAFT_853405 [Pilobolus umbonatus]
MSAQTHAVDELCNHCRQMLGEWDYMTECGHIICQACYHRSPDMCPLCMKKCHYLLIGEEPPKRLLEDVNVVIDFQLSSTLRLIQFLRMKIAKQSSLLDEVRNELMTAKDYKW